MGATGGWAGLFQEDEKYRQYQAGESRQVIPLDGLSLEDENNDEGEYGERDDLLDYLELKEVERTPILLKPDAVGGDGKTVFKEGDAPREKNDGYQRPAGGDLHLGKLEVAIPGQGHQHIGEYQHQYGPESLHSFAHFVKRSAKISFLF